MKKTILISMMLTSLLMSSTMCHPHQLLEGNKVTTIDSDFIAEYTRTNEGIKIGNIYYSKDINIGESTVFINKNNKNLRAMVQRINLDNPEGFIILDIAKQTRMVYLCK